MNIVWNTASTGSYGGTVFPWGVRYSLVNNVCGVRYSPGYRIHSDTGIDCAWLRHLEESNHDRRVARGLRSLTTLTTIHAWKWRPRMQGTQCVFQLQNDSKRLPHLSKGVGVSHCRRRAVMPKGAN